MCKLYALDGKVFDSVLIGADDDGCVRDDGMCCGCGIARGLEHNPGCDWEPCPRCSGQMGTCECDDYEMPIYDAQQAVAIIANLAVALRDTEATHA